MDEQKLLLPTYYIAQIAEELESHGVKSEQWLAGFNLSKVQLADESSKIGFDAYKALILNAISLSQQPSLGLLVGKRLGLTAHGMLGFAVMASSCLRETIDIISLYFNIRTPLIRIDQRNLDNQLSISLNHCYPLGEITRAFTESAVLVLYNMLMQVSEKSAPISKICFCYTEPAYVDLYQQYFDCEIVFNCQTTSIVLINKNLDEPLLMADKGSLEQAKQQCEIELVKLQKNELLQTRIRKYLLTFADGYPTLSSVSEYFNLSPRTLHRQLKSEATHYSKILKSVRQYKATELLENSTLTIQAIALTLGYSDVANFRKAFRKWLGLSPKDYRLKLRERLNN